MEPIFLIVDLFCGAGGTTTGFDLAQLEESKIAKVIACVNHDHKAIKSHWMNHPDVMHFEEDIRTVDVSKLVVQVNKWKEVYPDAYVVLWASLECTNFSKAKGGQPRDADSRTLADHLDRYVKALDPDYIQIENVVEFMSWGPLDDKGKPISKKNGEDWMRWRNRICNLGYYNEWKELNSANFGAYTSRNRLFGVFAKHGLPIAWPEPTHAKNPSKMSMHGDLQKWKPVKDVLDFSDEGESIFNRKKPLSDKTLERIFAGLVKYVAKGDNAFISKYFSGRPKGKVNSINEPSSTITTFGGAAFVQTKSFADQSIDQPAGTITTIDHHALVQTTPISLLKYNSTDKNGNHFPPSIEEPSPVLTTQDRIGLIQGEFIVQRNSGEPNSKLVDVNSPARTLTSTGGNMDLVQPCFLTHYYGQGGQHSSIDNPCPTITTKARTGLIQPEFLLNYNHSSEANGIDQPAPTLLTKDKLAKVKPEFFIDKHFGKSSQNQSIEQPAGTILPNDKHRLVEAVPFIMPTNFNNLPKSIEEPSPTITADRHHHYIVNPSHGGHSTSTEAPCPVIVARQDKAPLYLVQAETGSIAIAIYDGDSDAMIRIKQFMAIFGLVDIKMRMLRVPELLNIQGFPSGYKLAGNQADQKKFIGNSVVPHVVKCWAESMALKIINHPSRKVA